MLNVNQINEQLIGIVQRAKRLHKTIDKQWQRILNFYQAYRN